MHPSPLDPPLHLAARCDLVAIRQLGANLVRVYEPPPVWFLDLALTHDLRVFVDVPWNKDLCFLDRHETQRDIRDTLRGKLRPVLGHKAIFAVSVVNELPADVVRWSGDVLQARGS